MKLNSIIFFLFLGSIQWLSSFTGISVSVYQQPILVVTHGSDTSVSFWHVCLSWFPIQHQPTWCILRTGLFQRLGVLRMAIPICKQNFWIDIYNCSTLFFSVRNGIVYLVMVSYCVQLHVNENWQLSEILPVCAVLSADCAHMTSHRCATKSITSLVSSQLPF